MEDETWEPEENLTNANKMLRGFLAQNNLLPIQFKNDILSTEGNKEARENTKRPIKIEVKTEAVSKESTFKTNISENVSDDFTTRENEVC